MSEERISDFEVFSQVAQKIRGLVDANECRINVRFPFFADFALKNKEILNKEERYILAREIEPLLSYILADESDDDKRLRSFLPFDDDILTDDIITIFRNKINEVNSLFYRDSIQDIAKIRKSTKHMILKDISWELNKKIRTHENIKIKNILYATIKFSYEEPYDQIITSQYVNVFFPFSKKQNILFDFHKNDIDELIDVLTEIKKSFDNLD